jgi:predicted regulator of Ras-like GTPase activity (Roadblock/LC7/MglB family)
MDVGAPATTAESGHDDDRSVAAAEFAWMLEKFVHDTVGVSDAIAVSSDGLVLASATTVAAETVERFAAIASGMNSLTRGAADCFGQDDVVQVVVEMTDRFLFIARISEGACLGVVAGRDGDLGSVAYEMTLLVGRAGKVLTPELVQELQNLLVA